MATKRKTLSSKTRFEVFKRDSFKCQYCGASAPEAILVVDHIDPISKDGLDEMVNFITACQPCNAGKSDRKLDDNTALAKQKAQLDELNMRREQLEMMLKWRSGLKDIGESQVDAAAAAWSEAAAGWSVNETGRGTLRKHIRTFGLQAVLDAIETVRTQYIKIDAAGDASSDSVHLGFSKIGGVARMQSLPDDKRELHYIKGILRNRFEYVPHNIVKDLEAGLVAGVSVDDMKLEARNARTLNRFLQWLSGESRRHG